MVDITIIVSIFLFCLLSFVDFIVFNEEILLTLCFLSFIFFCFNSLSDSIFDIFESRASKFEEDLLYTCNASKNLLISDFNANLVFRSFICKFSILMASLVNYLSICKDFLEYKSSWIYHLACVAKLNELSVSSKNFIASFQKACVTQLLYSLILKKSNNDLTFLAVSSAPVKKLAVLKSLSLL